MQRKGVTREQLGDDPVIQPGDVLHCDVGITVARLNTDTQHIAYVLQPGETDAPAGLKQALANANAMQDIAMEEIRPGRTGNEILRAVLARMKAKGIDGTMYSHPIGMHGHGAGPLIGLWDYQEGVPGRGDAKVIPSMWFSIELQATTPVPEWGGQPVRMAQEEDMIVGADGKVRWALKRQDNCSSSARSSKGRSEDRPLHSLRVLLQLATILETVVAGRGAFLHAGLDHHVADLQRRIERRDGEAGLAVLLGEHRGHDRFGIGERLEDLGEDQTLRRRDLR